MGGVIRSNDPLQWGNVDGIILNEVTPASNVAGVATNVALLVGQSQRGPVSLTTITGLAMLQETFGKDKTRGLNKVLKNKAFGQLNFLRVVAADAAMATKTFNAGATAIIKFDAKSKGVYGNNLKVKIEAGSIQGKKYTISDENTDTVLTTEVYDNVLIAEAAVVNPFLLSKIVVATVLSTTAQPDNAAATVLVGGADGTVTDADYQTTIAKAEAAGSGNVIFLDAYSTVRNGYLKNHVASAQDKMAIVEGQSADGSSEAIAAVANLRDTDGRIIYAFNPAITNVDGVDVEQPAAWWIAAAFSQVPAHMDLAFSEHVKYMAGIVRLKYALNPTEYILLNKAGIAALEFDPDFGHKVKSAVTTQILNTEKQTILRRRMTDFLQDSVARYLKNYANGINSKEKRQMVKAGMTRFDDMLVRDGVLPGESEMTDGAKPKLIDVDSQNTNDSIGAGFFKIIYRRRIFSSMRYIVLSTEIGTGVVVTKEV